MRGARQGRGPPRRARAQGGHFGITDRDGAQRHGRDVRDAHPRDVARLLARRPDGPAQLFAGGRPCPAVPREHARDERIEGGRRVGPSIAQRRRLLEHDARERRHVVVVQHETRTRDALEQHASEGIDVRSTVDVARVEELLRRHVLRGADAQTGRRHGRRRGLAGDAEIDDAVPTRSDCRRTRRCSA